MRGTGVLIVGCVLAAIPAFAQPAAGAHPDLSGVWQVLNTAAWDLQDHSGKLGVPPGQGVVEGGEIPYQAWAATKKQENAAHAASTDPTEANCFLPGVPRATYMPYPFEIVQTPQKIAISYEFAHALRAVAMDGSPHPEGLPDTWMGDSRGHWEGDTLVVETTNFTDQTNFAGSGAGLRLVERFTRTAPDVILYEFRVDDPATFTRPWTAQLPMNRAQGPLYEYACNEGNYGMVGMLAGARAEEKGH